MKFQFKLDKLMKIREKFEENAKEELGKKMRERIEIEEKIELIDKRINDFSKGFDNELKNVVVSAKLQQMIEYRQYLKMERLKLVKLYQFKLQEEEKARQEYLKAKQDKEMLVKLKERRLEEFMKDFKTSEIKELDEIAQKKFIREQANQERNLNKE